MLIIFETLHTLLYGKPIVGKLNFAHPYKRRNQNVVHVETSDDKIAGNGRV